MLKVLIAAAEAAPFAKTGGLGDVIGSLPKELKKWNVDVRVIMPKYQDLPKELSSQMKLVNRFTVSVGWRQQYCGIETMQYDGVTFYFVDNQYYFKRYGFYGYHDDGERFSYFNKAVLEALQHIEFVPDVIHCNDWHTGMIPVLLRAHYKHLPSYENIKTVMTIHNLKYQGIFPKEILPDLLELDWNYFNNDGVEFYQQVNFMKAGIVFADCVTTVSRTYAKEIQQPYFGEGLDGLLLKVRHKLKGIVNGIDYELYNPAHDSDLTECYSADSLEKRVRNKLALQHDTGLKEGADIPLIAIVSRLVGQKGLDLIEAKIEKLLREDDSFELIVLGTGESRYENFFRYLDWQYGNRVSANIVFDEKMARNIYAAADIFLMPSLYEPCGIGQLLAMRYGCLPVVRETGGLCDTVEPYNEYTGSGTGFSFCNYDSGEMLDTVKRALALYSNNQAAWKNLMRQAMQRDFSWQESAKNYYQLYKGLL